MFAVHSSYPTPHVGVRRHSSRRLTALVFWLFAATACGDGGSDERLAPPSRSSGPLEGAHAPNAVVKRVVDGDTLVARVGKAEETVRLIGIDTPESVSRAKPVQCFGAEASEHLESLVPAGTDVTLILDVEARDVYDRLLAYVVRAADGLFVNLDLVETGHATVLDYPPNDHFAAYFARAQAEARSRQRGLWAACGGPGVPLH